MIGFELEVLAKKLDRFGWERDRGTAAHDRVMLDWMDALQDYRLDEVRAACRTVLLEKPDRMPHEAHIRAWILSERKREVRIWRRRHPPPVTPAPEPTPDAREDRRNAIAEIVKDRGFAHVAGQTRDLSTPEAWRAFEEDYGARLRALCKEEGHEPKLPFTPGKRNTGGRPANAAPALLAALGAAV